MYELSQNSISRNILSKTLQAQLNCVREKNNANRFMSTVHQLFIERTTDLNLRKSVALSFDLKVSRLWTEITSGGSSFQTRTIRSEKK